MKHFYTLDTLGTLDTLSTGPTTDEECKNSNEAKILQTNKRQSDNPIKFAANPVLSLPLLRNGRIHNFII